MSLATWESWYFSSARFGAISSPVHQENYTSTKVWSSGLAKAQLFSSLGPPLCARRVRASCLKEALVPYSAKSSKRGTSVGASGGGERSESSSGASHGREQSERVSEASRRRPLGRRSTSRAEKERRHEGARGVRGFASDDECNPQCRAGATARAC